MIPFERLAGRWRWMSNVNINAFEDYKLKAMIDNTQTLDRIAYNALIILYRGNRQEGNSKSGENWSDHN